MTIKTVSESLTKPWRPTYSQCFQYNCNRHTFHWQVSKQSAFSRQTKLNTFWQYYTRQILCRGEGPKWHLWKVMIRLLEALHSKHRLQYVLECVSLLHSSFKRLLKNVAGLVVTLTSNCWHHHTMSGPCQRNLPASTEGSQRWVCQKAGPSSIPSWCHTWLWGIGEGDPYGSLLAASAPLGSWSWLRDRKREMIDMSFPLWTLPLRCPRNTIGRWEKRTHYVFCC